MKHSLQLKLSQHLTLTPQLQQSIRLLQLSTVELNQELERYLAENPLLELRPGPPDELPPPPKAPRPRLNPPRTEPGGDDELAEGMLRQDFAPGSCAARRRRDTSTSSNPRAHAAGAPAAKV